MTAPHDARDLVAQAEQLEDLGADRLRELRAHQAALAAQQAQERAAVDDELAAAEQRFAAREAERLRAERLTQAREDHRVIQARYTEAADTATQHAIDVLSEQTKVADMFFAWLEAERHRASAQIQLTHTAQQLNQAGGNVSPPRIEDDQTLIIRQTDVMHPAAALAMILHPDDPRWRGTRLVGPSPRGFR
jgi:hypothetical protein